MARLREHKKKAYEFVANRIRSENKKEGKSLAIVICYETCKPVNRIIKIQDRF
jgi:hypothetical protein